MIAVVEELNMVFKKDVSTLNLNESSNLFNQLFEYMKLYWKLHQRVEIYIRIVARLLFQKVKIRYQLFRMLFFYQYFPNKLIFFVIQ